MNFEQTPDLATFLSTNITDGDPENDQNVTRQFAGSTSPDRLAKVISQTKSILAKATFSAEDLGSVANRWFASNEEAHGWLSEILSILESGLSSDGDSAPVKDSNGTVLNEGDSVSVIKDLKVKGGSSDLKRGTLIKKIHLIGDPENIECRVDGSTLVLKTCFLKKS